MAFKSYFPIKKLRKLAILFILFLFFYFLIRHYQIKLLPYRDIVKPIYMTQQSTIHISAVNHSVYFNEMLAKAPLIQINYNIHIFYYAWYANLEIDKSWKHWNHQRLPHWNKAIKNDFDQSRHTPPDDIGADFYPALGLYSSRDTKIRDLHMRMIRYTGIGVVVLSWYPGNMSDPNGGPVDDLVIGLLDNAHKYGLKVALHIEPYRGRTPTTVIADLRYLRKRYTRHPAYYHREARGRPLPVVFVYDSYRSPAAAWRPLLSPGRLLSVRGRPEDAFLVGLHLERDGCDILADSGFDAAYTYFVSETTSFGSSSDHWPLLARQCQLRNLTFLPSVGPGYKDVSVRPWNAGATEDRQDGAFFKRSFERAAALRPFSFGVTSFNEWHEGTQIEPAVPRGHSTGRGRYDDYLPGGPGAYLDLARALVQGLAPPH